MHPTNILFFGSTTDSVIVLERLSNWSTVNSQLLIVGIVTQPPRPVGRDKIITPTPVEIWGKAHHITVLSFENNADKPWLYADEQQVVDTLESVHADLLISASYGQKIPWETIQKAQHGGINVHPSLLPRWRGADPVPWAILSGDHQIGVSIVSLSEKFDEGKILAQKKISLLATHTSDPLRTQLFTLGAQLLIDTLFEYLSGKNKGIVQKKSPSTYAKKLTRDDGFEPWEIFKAAMEQGTDAERIERKFRALDPWPGIWTTLNNLQLTVNKLTKEKRLKILQLHMDNEKLILDRVQLEGKTPVSWKQFSEAYTKSILTE